MEEQFKKTIDSWEKLKDSSFFIAVSGGIDSMVLCHLFLQNKIPFHILHCNFQLRGFESDEDENFVKDFAKRNKIPISIQKFETGKIASTEKLGIQECARNLRYEWFFKEIKKSKNGVLVTAHHLNDSIETFFINTVRGTGLKGLKGISSDKVFRPLLSFKKSEIIEYAQNNKIEYREDSSNLSDKYLRNKIRQKIIPELVEIEPSYELKMGSLLNELNEISQFIEEVSSQFKKAHFQKESDYWKVTIKNILNQPLFLLSEIFSDFGLNRKKTKEFTHFLSSSTGSVFFSETHQFSIHREFLLFKKIENKKKEIILSIDQLPFKNKIGKLNIKVEILKSQSKIQFIDSTAHLDADKIKLPLVLRKWKKGDKIQPLGMKGKKLISDILIDKKTNLFEKENQWVLEQNGEIIWLIGKTISEKYKLLEKTKNVLVVEIC